MRYRQLKIWQKFHFTLTSSRTLVVDCTVLILKNLLNILEKSSIAVVYRNSAFQTFKIPVYCDMGVKTVQIPSNSYTDQRKADDGVS